MNDRGQASRVSGSGQAIRLKVASSLAAAGAAVAILFPAPIGAWAGTVAVTAVIVSPLLRVLWLIYNWWRERDVLFVAIGTTLLAVLGMGALLAALITS
jgi:hypothetical protein